MLTRRGAPALAAAVALVLVVLPGCGGDDFENKPKPAVALEATIEINSERVDVSPTSFGAGIVNFVIANNSASEAALSIKGRVDDTSSPIAPNGNGVFKVPMEQGKYEFEVEGNDDIEPATVEVGPPREPSNNELLLP